MDVQWGVMSGDTLRVREFLADHAEADLVLDRRARNLAAAKPQVTRERLWRAMLCMRLTTQQTVRTLVWWSSFTASR
jgi:hypothetical protein